MKTNKGISLIVLIITVIVMIIIAGTIIISLNDTEIMNQAQDAVDKTNLDEVRHLANMKWTEAFVDGKTTIQELETEVLNALYAKNIDVTQYAITITTTGVEVELKDSSSENWVTATVDGVPIPKGFVASGATGENTKAGGLVIYEGTQAVTDANVETAKRTRNQYVWIPVASEDFITKFVRKDFVNATSKVVNSLGTVDKFWEVVLDTTTNKPLTTQNTRYVTYRTLSEVQSMYESVKKYEGFYIARYETGIDAQRTSNNGLIETNIYSMMGKIPYTYVPWSTSANMAKDVSGAVQIARSMYSAIDTSDEYGVVSTLTYGVQWDTILQWWLDTNAVASVTDGRTFGNFNDHVITSASELNDGALVWALTEDETGSYVSKDSITLTYPKESGAYWALSTGALKVAKINNIYDMSGNVWEWTMEGYSTTNRSYRGGSFHSSGVNSQYPQVITYSQSGASNRVGFRIALYIK